MRCDSRKVSDFGLFEQLEWANLQFRTLVLAYR